MSWAAINAGKMVRWMSGGNSQYIGGAQPVPGAGLPAERHRRYPARPYGGQLVMLCELSRLSTNSEASQPLGRKPSRTDMSWVANA